MKSRDSFSPSKLIVVKRAVASTFLIPGSFVRLQSGGPIGVIESVSEFDCLDVCWVTPRRERSALPAVCVVSLSSACGVPRSEQPAEQS